MWSTGCPATLDALQAGQVDYGHVAAMVEATAYVDGEVCAQVEQRLITAGGTGGRRGGPTGREPELDLDLGDAGDVDGGDAMWTAGRRGRVRRRR